MAAPAGQVIARPHPKVAVRRQRATALSYLAFGSLGLLPTMIGLSPAWRAAGLGLLFPGAGFLTLWPWGGVLTFITLVLFGLAFVAWFAAALLVAPLLVWAGSIALAALLAPDQTWRPAPMVAAIMVAATIVAGCVLAARSAARQKAAGARREALLPQALNEFSARRVAVPEPGERELSERQLQHLRYLLDRALQPIDAFDGFDRIDQYQGAALRYQLNFTGYALALSQRHYTPNFHGYLSAAQRNVIAKYMDFRVWSYWIVESIGGHLNFRNFDPVGKDNIMMSGFFAMQVAFYMSTTGDQRYLEPGSLTFRRKNGKPAYVHAYPDLIDSITWNQDNSAYCLYPCEPNWIYSICNHMAMASLAADDRLRGRDRVPQVLPRWLTMLDNEMSDQKGSPISLRSSLTGFPLPFPTPDSMFVTFANCFAPERAERTWAIARSELSQHVISGEHGTHLELPGLVLDYGNYRPGYVWTLGQVANAAHEMGDEDFAAIVERTLDRDGGIDFAGGVARYQHASNAGNLYAIMAHLQRRNDFRNLATVNVTPTTLFGPLLTDAPYPEVLVARAVSTGDDLQLVLHPGGASGERRIGLGRLQPGRRYDVHFSSADATGSLIADQDGCAELSVSLDGRLEVTVTPASPQGNSNR